MMNQKPEVNDGDIENFYAHDPSNFIDLTQF